MSKRQVRVSKPPSDRVQFVKALRLIGNLGLKEASELALHLENFRDSVVVAGIEPEVATHIAEALGLAGAEVVVEECSISTPMLRRPAVNAKYAWHSPRLVKKVV
jgi:ribosomal protein L7/L12